HRHRQRARCLVRRQSLHVAREPDAAFHARAAGLQAAARAQRRHRALDARQDIPQARRHDHLLDDGADLVPGVVPAAAARGRGTAMGHAPEPILAPVGFNWQINVALIPGMAAREVAVAALGTVYAIEGGKEAAEQIGQALASKWSLATALAVLAWYIFAPQCA